MQQFNKKFSGETEMSQSTSQSKIALHHSNFLRISITAMPTFSYQKYDEQELMLK